LQAILNTLKRWKKDENLWLYELFCRTTIIDLECLFNERGGAVEAYTMKEKIRKFILAQDWTTPDLRGGRLQKPLFAEDRDTLSEVK